MADEAANTSVSTRPGREVAKDGSGTARNWRSSGGGQRNRLFPLPTLGKSSVPPSPMLEPVLHALRANHPKAASDVVERAFVVAERMHDGQRRASGDPYITHPVAVATILADIGMPPSVLAAALLHDTVEDTDYSLGDLTEDFGDEIALLVDGVTKLDKVKYGDAVQAETMRKMVVAMAKDVRVLVIKLADRLHNARTWRYVSASSAERKARETLEIYAPLAHRMGMNTIKWELEDRSFQVLYPDMYDEISMMVAEKAPARDEYLQRVKCIVESDMRESKIKSTVTGRPKHHYSIYQKMMVRGRDLDDIYDLIGVRILVDTVRDCYAALGTVHARWSPVPGRFKDYIAIPKFNMYQSLHTTVIGPDGKPVEIQIRTHAMHRRAEVGIAAHWKYKESNRDTENAWLRALMEWQRDTKDPGEFLDSLRYSINTNEVFVFTPKGMVIPLPSGSTPVDFAYAVHTEVGHRTIGAKVNDQLVALDSELNNGDKVEILTSNAEAAGPNRDWLEFVKSPRARSKIKQWFTKEQRDVAIERGRDELVRVCRKKGLPVSRIVTQESLVTLANEMRYSDVDSFFAAIGENKLEATTVVQKMLEASGGTTAAEEDLAEATVPTGGAVPKRRTYEGSVLVKGSPGVWAKLAKCCMPVPGDDIMGFVTRGQGVSVHRVDCSNAQNLFAQEDRVVEVEWAAKTEGAFLVQIQVAALDRAGLLADISSVLAGQHVDIVSATMQTTRKRIAVLRFTFEMGDRAHLSHVLAAVHAVKNVYEVSRVTGAEKQ